MRSRDLKGGTSTAAVRTLVEELESRDQLDDVQQVACRVGAGTK
jgi:hypothetical protein